MMNRSTAFIVVLCSFAIKVFFVGTDYYLYHTAVFFQIFQICIAVTQAIAYLFYPLLGWLSDIYFTRYKVIRLAFIIVIITYSVAVVCTLAIALDVNITYYKTITAIILIIMGIPSFLFMLLSLGMFEANAIQFGMDQLLESSSDQLSSFIHWYYWSSYAGQFLLYVITTVMVIVQTSCVVEQTSDHPAIYSI